MTTTRNALELWFALHDIEVRHWYDVNLNAGRTVHELYVEDGLFAVGPQERHGRDTIRTFYEARAKRGVRTARHLVTNFWVTEHEGTRARAVGIVSLYAGDQEPILESKPAVLMADLVNEYVLEADGIWRYQSHKLRPVFVGDDEFVRHAVNARG